MASLFRQCLKDVHEHSCFDHCPDKQNKSLTGSLDEDNSTVYWTTIQPLEIVAGYR